MLQELAEDNLAQNRAGKMNWFLFSILQDGVAIAGLMKPKFKKHAGEMESAEFVLADAEKFPESRKLAKVDNLPTFAAFRNGVLVAQTQTNKAENLKTFIDEAASN